MKVATRKNKEKKNRDRNRKTDDQIERMQENCAEQKS